VEAAIGVGRLRWVPRGVIHTGEDRTRQEWLSWRRWRQSRMYSPCRLSHRSCLSQPIGDAPYLAHGYHRS
jgi:hypothetical protein